MSDLKTNIPAITLSFMLIILFTSSTWAQVFVLGGRYPTGENPGAIVAADFDGDTDLDLAISQTDIDQVYIHLNDGTGDFATYHTVEMSRNECLHIADFNNDGYPDLLLYDEGWLSDNWGTTVYINNGDATFYLSFQDTLGSPEAGMCAADFNGDNNQDIATYSFYDEKGLWIFYGIGDGDFAPAVIIQPESDNQMVLRAGDVDNDGDNDILYSVVGGTFCLLNDGDGTFDEPLPTGSEFGQFADMNGEPTTLKYSGMTARTIQHEYDHLEGVLFEALSSAL